MSASANPQAILQSWGVPELQARLKFVLTALFIYCVGIHIPAPGMDPAAVQAFFTTGAGAGGLLGFIDIFSGGALSNFSIFALGVMPYINASIMMQLLVAVDGRLKELQQEGEEGRKRISKITRYLAIFLAFVQGVGFVGMIMGDMLHVLSFNGFTALMAVVAGTCFLMWLGDEISDKGVGNGLSILITIGILISVPGMIVQELQQAALDNARLGALLLFLLFTVAVITAIVWIQLSVRKVPVQYARRQIGRRVYGGQNTFLPLKMAQAGVIPLIFAISVLMVPPTVLNMMKNWGSQYEMLAGRYTAFQQGIWGGLLQFVLVFVFTFVYVAVTFNTQDIADNLKKNNGFIPGIRPGRPTFEFLDKVLHRVTFFGALYLSIISILPILINAIVSKVTNVQITSFYIGGTSLLIVVGVALDTVQQMQAHMVMRHYSGFNK
ncbi:preprotein translocase subunit SecY [bacterium]|nr:preprotein translocase subunit SecY [bacterium]